jgi:hypothetical protein
MRFNESLPLNLISLHPSQVKHRKHHAKKVHHVKKHHVRRHHKKLAGGAMRHMKKAVRVIRAVKGLKGLLGRKGGISRMM